MSAVGWTAIAAGVAVLAVVGIIVVVTIRADVLPDMRRDGPRPGYSAEAYPRLCECCGVDHPGTAEEAIAEGWSLTHDGFRCPNATCKRWRT
jgi:hypothetical protein